MRIYGKTIEELFQNAAEAMIEILSQSVNRRAQIAKKERIEIQSVDLNSLLVDFLSEILARSQINKSVYQVSSVRCQALEKGAKLEAEIIGHPVEKFDEDIKAVTYEDLDIKQIDNAWQTDLVLDI